MQPINQGDFESLKKQVKNIEKLLSDCNKHIQKNNMLLENILFCVESLLTEDVAEDDFFSPMPS